MFKPFSYYLKDTDEVKKQSQRCKSDLDHILEHVDDKHQTTQQFSRFLDLYSNFLKSKELKWEAIWNYETLEDVPNEKTQALLKRLIVIKLNGGLGTTMGCKFPKSLITVRDGMNFLDINLLHLCAVNEKYGADIPLVLMNSFYTEKETQRTLQRYSGSSIKIHTFVQSKYPRICNDTLMPTMTPTTVNDETCWYPPGHGDFYQSFYDSGLLQKFLEEGRDIVFVSNIDNLGATIDLKLLACIANASVDGKQIDFMMELTEKTKADVKGGTLIEYNDKIKLLEIAQVPKDHVEEFKSVSKFKFFNTNNIWLNSKALKNLIDIKPLKLDVITNKKALNGSQIIQLETAIGAAIMNFPNSIGLNVPRARFLPVKNNSDLLLVMSNLYVLQGGHLVMNPKRNFQNTPIIQLSGPFFKNVKDFLERFSNIPDILALDYLAVSGDVCFDRDVSLKGTVIILAQHGDHIDIPRNSVLENKIISGNLRIVDH